MGILGGEVADVDLARGWWCCMARYCCISDGILLVIVTFLGGCMDAVIVFRAAPKYVIFVSFIVVICVFDCCLVVLLGSSVHGQIHFHSVIRRWCSIH